MDGYNLTYADEWDLEDSETIYIPDPDANSYVVTDLLPCIGYNFSLSGTTQSGSLGEPAMTSATMDDVVMGPPSGLRVESFGCDYMEYCWSEPEENGQCADTFEADFIELAKSGEKIKPAKISKKETRQSGNEYCLLYSELFPDTDYYFGVFFISPEGVVGQGADIIRRTLLFC